MRHDWIFDVLADLRSYAVRNGLPALAEQVEVALRVAREEIAADAVTREVIAGEVIAGGDDDPDDGMPPKGRPH